MLPSKRWAFCRNLDCHDRKSIFRLRDRHAAREWLKRWKGDLFRMLDMRRVLSNERLSRDLSRISDDAVITQIADLMASGRLHLHVEPLDVVSGGGTTFQIGSAAPSAETLVPFPISERKPPASHSSSGQPSPAPDPATFPSNADFAAQASVLIAAAEAGTPACYI